jgi:hypothetical protein
MYVSCLKNFTNSNNIVSTSTEATMPPFCERTAKVRVYNKNAANKEKDFWSPAFVIL